MASPSQLSFGAVEIWYDQAIGDGAYGKVCKAKYGQLPCAAKLLHDTMLEGSDPGISTYAERFEQECQFLSMIKHPNIVQHLGTHRNPQTQRLALLMELMDESLTRFLERSTGPIPYHTELNICHDIALALSYLHSNAIIHRDLSSNNVLLIGEGSRAKVADFGMYKLMDVNPRMSQLTVCPGAQVYMPPEALLIPPHYSSKLDCFSHGVLTIQILTRNFPRPGAAHKPIEDPNYLAGPIILPVPESERRKKDIDTIAPNHPLLPIALHCLRNRATERPSADQLYERLATLKREERYTHSVEQTRNQASLVQTLREELVQKDQIIQRERAEHENELAQRDEILCNERAGYEKQTEQLRETQQQTHDATPGATQDTMIRPTLRQGEPTPIHFTSIDGSAIAHRNMAYFSHEHEMHSFSLTDNKWTRLPDCPCVLFTLAVVDDILTTVGGVKLLAQTKPRVGHLISTLWSLTPEHPESWEKVYPPMLTIRRQPAVATTSTHLLVAGGYETSHFQVDVLDIGTRQWSTTPTLTPQWPGYDSLFPLPQMILCEGRLYLSKNTDLISCSVEELLKSVLTTNSSKDAFEWTKLANLPYFLGKTLVTMRGHILALEDRNHHYGEPSADIRCYDQATNSWRIIKQFPIDLFSALVTVLGNEMIVVGGRDEDTEHAKNTYIIKL